MKIKSLCVVLRRTKTWKRNFSLVCLLCGGESQSKEARDFQRGTHVTFMRFISFDHQSGLLAPNLTVFFLLELLIRVPLF